MIPRVLHPGWRKNACFCGYNELGFPNCRNDSKFALEAYPSNTRDALHCQNRYPSPSGWSGSYPRARPPKFPGDGQEVADGALLRVKALADGLSINVIVGHGQGTQKTKGNLTCKRNSPSFSLRRFSGLRAATKAPILSAPSSAPRSAARPAKSFRTASASPARPSALPQAHWRTTSRAAPFGAEADRARKGARTVTWAAPADRRAALFRAMPGAAGTGREQCSRRS